MIDNKDHMPIAVRSYVCKPVSSSPKEAALQPKKKRKNPMPSEYAIVFDTETTTDAAQKLRFGTYQVRKGVELMENGVFYDLNTLAKTELKTLEEYAKKAELEIRTVQDFIEEIFFGIGYQWRATIVGFNLPFDISRLAIGHSTARASKHNKIMQGGFSFKLSENTYYPRVQIKHISSRNAFIQFAATMGQILTKGERKKGFYQAVRRGFFIDVKTLAAALMSKSHSLDSLAKALGVTPTISGGVFCVKPFR